MSERAGMHETTTASVDEQRIARGLAIGLPIVTIAAGAVVAVAWSPATSILVLAAGLLLGVIAILWTSLRTLTGDAPLSPEFEALEMSQHGGDALSARKTMLLRALKDLENERALGKIELEDYEQLALSYRQELKLVLKRIDEALEPRRAKAEELAKRHLQEIGLGPLGPEETPHPLPSASTSLRPALEGRTSASSETPSTSNALASTSSASHAQRTAAAAPERVACRSCGASNEADAKFCKECSVKLTTESNAPPASTVVESSHDA